MASSPLVINCVMYSNTSGSQGATITNWTPASGLICEPKIINCIFYLNAGGAVYNHTEWDNCILTNCILWNNSPTEVEGGSPIVSYSNVQGGWPGEGNIDADPCFVNPDSNDFHLLPDSPCIDAGDPNYVAGPNETDLDGKPRILDGNNDGNSVVDMGAYEYDPFVAEFVIVERERIGRTLFKYTCKVILNNFSPGAVRNVYFEIVSVPDNMTIIDPNVTFDYIAAWKSTTSGDTCSFKVDRSQSIVLSKVIWKITYEIADIGQGGQQMSYTMGFFEPPYFTGDFTGEGIVNFVDLARLANKWLWTGTAGSIPEDIVKDGSVDFLDFAVLAENWME